MRSTILALTALIALTGCSSDSSESVETHENKALVAQTRADLREASEDFAAAEWAYLNAYEGHTPSVQAELCKKYQEDPIYAAMTLVSDHPGLANNEMSFLGVQSAFDQSC